MRGQSHLAFEDIMTVVKYTEAGPSDCIFFEKIKRTFENKIFRFSSIFFCRNSAFPGFAGEGTLCRTNGAVVVSSTCSNLLHDEAHSRPKVFTELTARERGTSRTERYSVIDWNGRHHQDTCSLMESDPLLPHVFWTVTAVKNGLPEDRYRLQTGLKSSKSETFLLFFHLRLLFLWGLVLLKNWILSIVSKEKECSGSNDLSSMGWKHKVCKQFCEADCPNHTETSSCWIRIQTENSLYRGCRIVQQQSKGNNVCAEGIAVLKRSANCLPYAKCLHNFS